MKKSETQRHVAEEPSVKELLSRWPGGLRDLAFHIGYSPAALTWFHQAGGVHFPAEMAARCVNAFRTRRLTVLDEPLTEKRLRLAWRRRKNESE